MLKQACYGFLISFFAVAVLSGECNAVATSMEVIGKVSFEKRQTIIPLVICEAEPCLRSEPYWVLILEQDEKRFELGAIFAKGSDNAPESIELLGVLIRPGARIQLEGWVSLLSEKYAVITHPKRVSVLMDAQN